MAKDKNVKTGNGLVIKTDLSAVTQQIKKSMSDVSKEIKDSSEKTIAAISSIPQEQTSTLPDKKLDAISVGINSIRTNLQHTNRSLNYIAVKMNDQLTLMKAEANATFDRRDDFAKKTETKESGDNTRREEDEEEKKKPKGLFTFIGDWIKNLFGKSLLSKFLAGLATFWGMVKVSAAAFANTKLGGILTGIFRTLGAGLLRLIPWVALATGLFTGIGNALNSEEVARVTKKKKEDIGISDRLDVGMASVLSMFSFGVFSTDEIYNASKKLDAAVLGLFTDSYDYWTNVDYKTVFSDISTGISNFASSIAKSVTDFTTEWAKESPAFKGWVDTFSSIGNSISSWWKRGVEEDKKVAEKARKRNKALFDKAINSIVNATDIEFLKQKWNELYDYFSQLFGGFADKARGLLETLGLWKPSKGAYDRYDKSSLRSVQRTLNETPEEVINKGIDATDFFIKQGWTDQQAAAIAGNLGVESRFNPAAVGDNGEAYGIAQWHKDRQDKFKELYGKDIKGSSLQEQLKFVDWELKNSEGKAGELLKSTTDVTQAARTVDKTYERSAGYHVNERVELSQAIDAERRRRKDEAAIAEFNKLTTKPAPKKAPVKTLREELIATPTIPQKPKTGAPKQKVQDKEEKIQRASEKPKSVAEKEAKPTTVAVSSNTSNNSKSDVYFIQQAPMQTHAGVQNQLIG